MSKEIVGESGKVYQWNKPPRYVHWRHGRIAHSFHSRFRAATGETSDLSHEERGLRLFEQLTEDEAICLEAYVSDVVRSGLGITLDEVRLIPEGDFWQLFALEVYGLNTAQIETTEGVTDAQTVSTFRTKPLLPETGEDVPHVPGANPGPTNGNIRSAISG